MARLIKVSDIRELIYEYDKEDVTIGKMAEILEERFLERMQARGHESWGELEAEWNDSEMTPFQWLELYYHPPIRK